MEAGRLVLAARRRMGLTQRELAKRTGIPQPMISAIERGRQDPRHSTLDRILAAADQELDIVARADPGIDRTQFVESLRLSPGDRLRRSVAATHAIHRLVRNARRVR